jgi:hypothetical protein
VDAAEKHVAEFLHRRGHSFSHEPDGNIPPDFLVDDRIAVEVERLIKYHESEIETGRTIAETAIPLWLYIEKLTLELGPPTHDASWDLSYSIRRPVDWKKLKRDLKQQLLAFRNGGSHQKTVLNVVPNFKLEIRPAPRAHETFFVVLRRSDQDEGGFWFDDIERSATICIANKTRKIEGCRSKYSAWWLVLVDFIAHGLGDRDVEQFKSQVSVPHSGWDKVIVLSPHDPTRFFEI